MENKLFSFYGCLLNVLNNLKKKQTFKLDYECLVQIHYCNHCFSRKTRLFRLWFFLHVFHGTDLLKIIKIKPYNIYQYSIWRDYLPLSAINNLRIQIETLNAIKYEKTSSWSYWCNSVKWLWEKHRRKKMKR